MKTIAVKTGIFLIFCITSVLIIACTQEFAVSVLDSSEPVIVSPDVGGISGFQMILGYRDSLPLVFIEVESPEVSAGNGQAGLDSLRSRVNRFRFTFNEAVNADGYEIRALKLPVTDKNWQSAEELFLTNISTESGVVYGEAVFTTKPVIRSGKCIGCGACELQCPSKAISTKSGKAIIDYEKCIKCGQCFRTCPYESIEGSFAGTPYYLAVRPYKINGEIREYSSSLHCTQEAYVVQYTTLASIPDSLKKQEVTIEGSTMQLKDLDPSISARSIFSSELF